MIGKLTKPFALAIRLFANMTAGHIVVLALIGLIFAFKSIASGAPFLMAIGDHDARAVRRVPAGVHLHAPVERVHRADSRRGSLAVELGTGNG